MPTHRRLGLVFVMAALVCVSACGGTGASGIYGIAVTNHGGPLFGPHPSLTPSPLPGGFGLSHLEPDSHRGIVVRAVAGDGSVKVVAKVQANADGIFKVTLPPGRYQVLGAPPYSSDRKSVTVRAGAYTRVVVRTGVRH
jgi:hypothetical protein